MMPLKLYFGYVGSGLLTLLFGLNWLMADPPIKAGRAEASKSSIRISSIERLPERIIFDTRTPQPAPGVVRAIQRSAFVFAQITPGPLARFEPKRPRKMTLNYSTDRFQPVI
jgi:hypothetical protein